MINTGVKIAIPKNFYGRIASRSSMAMKGIDVCAGVIDSDYRGEIKVLLYNTKDEPFEVNLGDRIAQIIFTRVEYFNFQVVSDLANSQRGEGGFGSTGAK